MPVQTVTTTRSANNVQYVCNIFEVFRNSFSSINIIIVASVKNFFCFRVQNLI